jgi:hypothetical protein
MILKILFIIGVFIVEILMIKNDDDNDRSNNNNK